MAHQFLHRRHTRSLASLAEDAFPQNEMKDVDFTRARLLDVYFALRNVASGMTSIFFASEYVFSPGYTT
jgi:hypothetical protein